ncbi:ABC transporter permease [Microlunatus speluncae]|uniref:ABC transporter permease n=1 Tax=Microlunatus speluncae TaxID=2594267 RepID=UPI00126630CF|nr:FtsX-like permease family protein [Microlunatus speluncae]
MLRLALRELRNTPGRMVAVLGAIAISVGFLSACMTFLETEQAAVAAAATRSLSTSDIVVDAEQSRPEDLAAIRSVAGVAAADPIWSGGLQFRGPEGSGRLGITSVPGEPALRWADLTAGDWPRGADQIAVGQSTAQQHGLEVGSVITVSDESTGADHPLTVSGIVDQSRSLFAGIDDSGYVTQAYFEQSTAQAAPGQTLADWAVRYLIITAPGADQGQVLDGLRSALPTTAVVAASEEVAQQTLLGLSGGVDTYGILLQGFGAVALLVGGIMIANTFAILIAQRRRQIGLLRAVGATGGDVRRMVLAEAFLVGVVGAAIGIGLGIGLATIGAALSGSISNGLALPWVRLALAAAVGVIVTVVAASVPAARSSRITPLEALRPVDDHRVERRRTMIIGLLALGLMLAGSGVIWLALSQPSGVLLPAIAGAFLFAVGIIAAAPVYVPLLVRGFGLVLRRFGPVSRVAAANTARHPGRAAATCAALMIAVGLVVTLQVGAASVKATTDVDAQQRYPVDVTVSAGSEPLPGDLAPALARVPGIGATTEIRQVRAALAESDGTEFTIAGLADDADSVVREGLDRLDAADVALIGPYTARILGLTDGQQVTVTTGGSEATYRLRFSRVPEDFALVVRGSTLAALAPKAPVAAVWASAVDRSAAQAVSAAVVAVVDQRPGLQIGGSLAQAAQMGQLIDALLAGATALLGVAIVIALIGVGNTLGLSVIERQRESALLRALGLERRQLRRMLAIEAIVLALVAVIVGIAAGIGFGFLGTTALARDAGMSDTVLAVSAPQTAVVVIVALLAGGVASILPGLRAARVPPAAALAQAT